MGKYIIYLRRNTANGKCYVGQTSDFKRREYQWRCLKNTYTNKYIDEDREKYGFDAWSVEVLAEADNREDAWELEQRFINNYNSLYPFGYNLAKGGSGGSGIHPSDETKQKISETLKGRKRPEELKQKISKIMKKQVYQYTLDNKLVKIWPSTMECDSYNQGAVAACCRKCYIREGNDIYKGYRWSYKPL